MNRRQRTPRHDQATIRSASKGNDLALDFAGVVHIDWGQLNAERRRHCLDCRPLTNPSGDGRVSRITAALVMVGVSSLRSSNHFPLMPASIDIRPVALPPGRAKLST